MTSPPRGLFLVLAIFATAAVAIVVVRVASPPDPRQRFEALRGELQDLRAASDSCREAVAAEEARFRSYSGQLDSLRARVREYEALDPRGVPADSYAAYLETFQTYNRGVPRWNATAETLQAHWGACREITESHNAVADSARRLAAELGLWPDTAWPDTQRAPAPR